MASLSPTMPPQAARPASGPMRVGIVDEYPAHVEGLARVINGASSMEVVLTATSGREAHAQIAESRPDVIVIEPWMRSGDGLALAAVVSREHPEITIIALSRLWDDGHVAESLGAGMAAHLPKTTPLDDLPALIRQATRGVEVRPASTMRSPVRPQMTARERGVLRLAARGLSNVEIGRELFVTEQTVKFHLANIYRKLGVRNRTQASHAAAQAGMLG